VQLAVKLGLAALLVTFTLSVLKAASAKLESTTWSVTTLVTPLFTKVWCAMGVESTKSGVSSPQSQT
jgi:hypothetical protein